MINFIISKLNNSAPAKCLTAKVNLLSGYYDVNLIILKSLDTFCIRKSFKECESNKFERENFSKKNLFFEKIYKK